MPLAEADGDFISLPEDGDLGGDPGELISVFKIKFKIFY